MAEDESDQDEYDSEMDDFIVGSDVSEISIHPSEGGVSDDDDDDDDDGEEEEEEEEEEAEVNIGNAKRSRGKTRRRPERCKPPHGGSAGEKNMGKSPRKRRRIVQQSSASPAVSLGSGGRGRANECSDKGSGRRRHAGEERCPAGRGEALSSPGVARKLAGSEADADGA